MTKTLKIGTRGSPLALAQAHETRARLMAAHGLPDEAFEIVIISTTGDRVQNRALREIGGKGLFTKEIEEAMLSGEIDIAVHSSKDMPVEQPQGLVLDCFLEREDPRDAFVTLDGKPFSALPQGAVVGTSSLRRKAQLLAKRPDVQVVEFRGNVQTRMRKLADGVAEATFLAQAGLNRLNAQHISCQAVEPEDMLPAIAQGVIGIERRADDAEADRLLAPLRHAETHSRVAAERALLAGLDGSCETPIAGLATLDGNTLTLRGEILRTDGSEVLTGSRTGPAEDAAEMGASLAEELLAQTTDDFFDWK
ncbi:hydroxymethylbilane synthase [Vannielia litorea]|uniref:hydroxymethylbilane synthase n=1 Tax=Vannielia litorea TaxID=1217970 RepID=UPI001C970250|nr:hydroxymethylbilane synthase [Vannielia litorea]MBY6154781.1 hydroxymethylbilane synthase [Vannielia litorea]